MKKYRKNTEKKYRKNTEKMKKNMIYTEFKMNLKYFLFNKLIT
jgi:hypothetical protein